MDLIQAAAEHLAGARRARTRGPRLPEASRPADIASALEIQARVTTLLGEPVGGWKASAPSAGKVMRAPIYARDIRSGEHSPIMPVEGVAESNLRSPSYSRAISNLAPDRPRSARQSAKRTWCWS